MPGKRITPPEPQVKIDLLFWLSKTRGNKLWHPPEVTAKAYGPKVWMVLLDLDFAPTNGQFSSIIDSHSPIDSTFVNFGQFRFT